MARVLALDPGDRVGWARADIADDGSWSNLRHGITELKPMAMAVDRALQREPITENLIDADVAWRRVPHYDVVVCEEWRLYGHLAKQMVGSEIPSAQFIGMVKLACWKAGVPLVMQPARQVNSNKPDVLSPAEGSMKRLRPELFELVTQPGAHDDLHDMVAVKHLWLYTFKNFPTQEITHASEPRHIN